MWWVNALAGLARVLVSNLIAFLTLILRSRTSWIAENLFLRKQLAFYQEHKRKPQLLTDAARWSLVLWSRLFDWRSALVIVKPDTLIGWHRKGFQRFWRCKSRPGRPPLQEEIREWIVRMAKENPTGARGE
jgi:putative transposase